MPTFTYEQLSKMKVAELRQIAENLQQEELKGVATMHKEKLLPLLCKALGVEAHTHHEVVGVNKTAIKQKIRALKKQRDEAIQAKKYDELRQVRGQIKGLIKDLRRHTV